MDHAEGCACCSHAAPGQQSLDELAFLKSACAAAQHGNVGKLERILRDHPTAVSNDGVGGVPPCMRAYCCNATQLADAQRIAMAGRDAMQGRADTRLCCTQRVQVTSLP